MCYRRRHMSDDPKQVLWKNVEKLMVLVYGTEHLTNFALDTGIGPGTVARMKARKTSIGIDTLHVVAKAWDCRVWQLLDAGWQPGPEQLRARLQRNTGQKSADPAPDMNDFMEWIEMFERPEKLPVARPPEPKIDRRQPRDRREPKDRRDRDRRAQASRRA